MAAKASRKTRKQKAAKKTVESKKEAAAELAPLVIQVPSGVPEESLGLVSVWRLTKQSAVLVWTYKKVLGGIAAIYVLLDLLLAQGFASGIDVMALHKQLGGHLTGGLRAYMQLLGSASSSASDAAGLYQSFLFVMVTLALIWTLRHIWGGQRTSIRDAYYKGMGPLVPFILLMLLMGLQLLPLLAGTIVYGIVTQNGIAATSLEALAWLIGVFALGVLSLYWWTASLFSLFIVTLPDMAPLQAHKLARKLVHGRRWLVARKMLFLPFVLVLAAGVIMVPIIIVVPAVAPFVLSLLAGAAITIAAVYLYTMYRGLMYEFDSSK